MSIFRELLPQFSGNLFPENRELSSKSALLSSRESRTDRHGVPDVDAESSRGEVPIFRDSKGQIADHA